MDKREQTPRSTLLALIDEGFQRKAWHGPNLQSALRGVGAAEAVWSPGPDRPSIWSLVLHCAYWKSRVMAHLGGTRFSPDRLDRDFPRLPEPADERAWRADRQLLRRTHAALLDLVEGLAPDDLRGTSSGGRTTPSELLRGIAFHDVYHAGQIRLIRKLRASSAR